MLCIEENLYKPMKHNLCLSKLLKRSAPHYPITRSTGDIDKLCRSTLDGLSISSGGILLRDDSLVVNLRAKKQFATKGGFQGAFIHIWTLT